MRSSLCLIAAFALAAVYLTPALAESETCKKDFPKELVMHATIDANYSFTKAAKIPLSWVNVIRATCKQQKQNYNVTIWFKADDKADREFIDANASSRCRIEYTFNDTKKLVDTRASCL